MVYLYSKNNCVQCTATKRALADAGREYVEFNVEEDPAAMNYIVGRGHKQAPVVVVSFDETPHDSDGHVVHEWSGFNPDLIASLARIEAVA